MSLKWEPALPLNRFETRWARGVGSAHRFELSGSVSQESPRRTRSPLVVIIVSS